MKIADIFPIHDRPMLQKILSILALCLPWAGLGFSYLLDSMGIIENPGEFIWGLVLGSFVLCALALLFEKKDIVAILTPVYTVIIFFSMELPWTILLQVLYACTLTVLLWRLLTKFGVQKSIQYA